MRHVSSRALVRGAVAGLWLGALALGLLAFMRVDSTAGAAGLVPASWPDTAPLHLASDRATIVATLHPHCPCSAASLETLAAIVTHAPVQAPRVYLLFFADPAKPDDWVDAALWRRAAALPFVRVRDAGGQLGVRFGALTSGAVVVYHPDGRRGYAGGLTPSRGTGVAPDRIAALAARVFAPSAVAGATSASQPAVGAVYGCPLQNPVAE